MPYNIERWLEVKYSLNLAKNEINSYILDKKHSNCVLLYYRSEGVYLYFSNDITPIYYIILFLFINK